VTEMSGRNEEFRVKGSSVGVRADYSFRAWLCLTRNLGQIPKRRH
jgi:hypothetical protein